MVLLCITVYKFNLLHFSAGLTFPAVDIIIIAIATHKASTHIQVQYLHIGYILT